MTDTLQIRLNRTQPDQIQAGSDPFRTEGNFTIGLFNEGESAHVHIQLEGDLSRVATVSGDNHYLEAEDSLAIPVTVSDDGPRPLTGTIRVVTGFGKQERVISVTLEEPTVDEGVAVDDSLSQPPSEPEPNSVSLPTMGSLGNLPVIILAVVALALSGVALMFTQNTEVTLSVGAVIITIAIALLLLIR